MLVIFHKHIEMTLIITIVTKELLISGGLRTNCYFIFMFVSNACLSLKKMFYGHVTAAKF